MMTPDFDAEYMRKRLFISWRGPVIADAIIGAIGPRAVLDVGCATGDVMRGLLDAGVQAWGVDPSPDAGACLTPDERARRLIIGDVADPAVAERLPIVDLVILVEVLPILSADRRLPVLQEAAVCGLRLLVNRLNAEEEEWLAGEGLRRSDRRTWHLRHLLEPDGRRQALKALYLTGEVWVPAVEADAEVGAC
jgi:SAM-dependent methyltransferase